MSEEMPKPHTVSTGSPMRGDSTSTNTRVAKANPARHKSIAVAWPTFDSIQSCAGSTGVPSETIKLLKSEGCPAFRSNRIYFGELLPWLFRPRDGEPVWALELEKYKALREKQEWEKNDNVLVEFDEALALMRETFTPIRQFLIAAPSSLCARCNPSDPQHAREAIEAWVNQGLTQLSEMEREKIKKA